MSSTAANAKDDSDEIPPPQAPPSPPPYTTFAARGVHVGDLREKPFITHDDVNPLATDVLCFQTARLPDAQSTGNDTRRLELRWKETCCCWDR